MSESKNINTYERDFYQWTVEQTQALREQNLEKLDWENIIEEIEALGRSDYHAVVSLLTRIIQHRLKIDYADQPQINRHWQAEIKAFSNTVRRRYSTSMKPKLELEWQSIYSDAIDLYLIDYPPSDFPEVCPYYLNRDINKTLEILQKDVTEIKIELTEAKGEKETLKIEINALKEDVKNIKISQQSQTSTLVWVLIWTLIGILITVIVSFLAAGAKFIISGSL